MSPVLEYCSLSSTAVQRAVRNWIASCCPGPNPVNSRRGSALKDPKPYRRRSTNFLTCFLSSVSGPRKNNLSNIGMYGKNMATNTAFIKQDVK